jgi:hypothetical protein
LASRLVRLALVTVLATVLSPAALAAASSESRLAGTDLLITYPDGWERRKDMGTAEEIRAFVEEWPDVAGQFGMRPSDTDEDLLVIWQGMAENVVDIAWDPTDGDTVTVFVHDGTLPPNLVAWRAREKSLARDFKARLVSVDQLMIGTHRAYTSIKQLRRFPVLFATAVVEQADRKFVAVSVAVDEEDRPMAKQLLASLKRA